MQLRPTFTLRNLLPTDHAGNSKTKAACCQSAAILTKTFSLKAVSLTFKEKREDYLTLIRVLKDENVNVMISSEVVKRWKVYFEKLINEENDKEPKTRKKKWLIKR